MKQYPFKIASEDGVVRITGVNVEDDKGNPYGGDAIGTGLSLLWQKGLVEQGRPNGVFVEDVLKIAVNRLKFYQEGRFECEENQRAINLILTALTYLEDRRKDRKERGVEGTHEL